MNPLLLLYACSLYVGVVLSGIAHRTLLSTAVVFLLAGAAAGALGVMRIDALDPSLRTLSELALVSILFSDGMKASVKEIREAWHLPGRALLIGLPLTLLATALLTRLWFGWPWSECLLVGAALSPTDPVFAAGLIGSRHVPWTVRHLLNLESGLNDGLALPFVLVLLAGLSPDRVGWAEIGREVLAGMAIGVAAPVVGIGLLRAARLRPSEAFRPLLPLSILLLTYSLSLAAKANPYLAAFLAGICLTSLAPRLKDIYHGEQLSELFKLAALLVFGAVLLAKLRERLNVRELLAALSVLFVARPVAILLALVRSGMNRRERLIVAWFGPKGFASVVFALLILGTRAPHAETLFHFTALAIGLSIVLHSSSDVPIARWLESRNAGPESADDESAETRERTAARLGHR